MKHSRQQVTIKPGEWAKQRPLGAALLAMAEDLGPGQRMPTVRELCRRFDVSTSTLDPVLRSLELRGAIVRRHGQGIFVSASVGQKTVGVVFGGDIFGAGFSPFWSLMLQAVRQQAGAHGMQPRAYLDISDPSRLGLGGHSQLVEDLEAHRLDGLLLLAPQHIDNQTEWLSAQGVPLVVFGGRDRDWSVTHDMERFAVLAARDLGQAGCRRVAVLGGGGKTLHPVVTRELRRLAGEGIGLVDWSYEAWARRLPGVGTHENCAYRMVQHAIVTRDESPLPDGVISMDDTMTRGAITAMQQAGLAPGRDMRIVSASNRGSPVLAAHLDEIVCLEFDPEKSVRAALTMLATLMDGGTPPTPRVLIVPSAGRRDAARTRRPSQRTALSASPA